jgi:hypothetical protein
MMSNNGILWKKTYGCLEVIPTVMFQLIQGFAEVLSSVNELEFANISFYKAGNCALHTEFGH